MMPTMRAVFTLALLVSASGSALPAQAYRAAPSTRATTEVSLTLVDTAAQRAAGAPALIRVDYGQPHLRGRRLNTDSLVPLGTVWRLGANAATLLSTGVDLTIGGSAVPKGRYVMWALPEASGWTLILQRETTGAPTVMAGTHDPTQDFARIPLRMSTLATPVESLTITLVPDMAPGAQRGDLRIAWGHVMLEAPWTVQ
jgi:hypothetical protein